MSALKQRVLMIAALLATVLLIGTLGFVIIDHYPWFDAFYMSVITITTVGYSEIRPLSQSGRIFNSFLLLFGVSIMFFAVGAITQSVIEIQFNDVFQKRRTKKMIDQLRDHYILCGFGRVGRGAAAELMRTSVPFIVVDNNADRVERAMRAGMLAVLADVSQDENLIDIGIRRARGLIAALPTDAENVFLILSAKSLNGTLKIAARVAEEGSEAKMKHAGADAIFMPYSMTGYRLAQSILRPHVFEFLDITTTTSSMGLNIGIEQVEVSSHSSQTGKSLKDLQLRSEVGVIVLAIRRSGGKMMFNPPAHTNLEGGDSLIVMGASEDVQRLQNIVDGN